MFLVISLISSRRHALNRHTEWIARRLSAIPAATVHTDAGAEHDITLRFGDGPEIGVEVISLTQTGTLTLSRMVDAVLPRESGGVPRIYATPTLRSSQRDRMAEERLSWIESGGGAVHLDLGPYYIHDITDAARSVEAATQQKSSGKRQRGGDRPARLIGHSGVCAEAIILWWLVARQRPDQLPPLTPTTLAEVSGVTAPLAGRVLHRLEQLGALSAERVGRRTSSWSIENVEKVMETWVDEDREPVRVSRAYVYARHAGDLHSKLAGLSDAFDAWALGGVAAANQYAPTLTADPMPTVWIPDYSPAETAARAIGGEIVSEGANVIFWQEPKDSWTRFTTGTQKEPPVLASDRATERPELQPRMLDCWVREMIAETSQGGNAGAPDYLMRMVSPVRALQQTLQDDRGRSDQVALALSELLRLSQARAPAP